MIRQDDHLSPGVQGQPGKHETPDLKKKKKEINGTFNKSKFIIEV
jgi:hypothetical protein